MTAPARRSDILVTENAMGTWHVLELLSRPKCSGVIYFSSAQVFGCAEGEGIPRLSPPIDDDYLVSRRPADGTSQRLAEEMCAALGVPAPASPLPCCALVMVPDNQGLSLITQSEAEFGASVDVDDVAEATALASEVDVLLHARPYSTALVVFDTTVATKVLGWLSTSRLAHAATCLPELAARSPGDTTACSGPDRYTKLVSHRVSGPQRASPGLAGARAFQA